MFFTSVLSLFSFAAAALAQYADPGACSGNCWTHDPSVVRRSDGQYFRFSTGSEIGIFKASALTGPWVYEGAAIPAGSKIDLAGNTDLWAPDVQLVGSTYIMYYSVSTFGVQTSAIGYATSSTMEYGSWTDHGATGVASTSAKPYNAIDPNLIKAASGSYYLQFGSFWNDIYQVQLNSGATAPSGSAYQIAYNATGQHALEGSHMWYRDGIYYLFFSSGTCCGYDTAKPTAGNEYKIFVCASSSVSGPFVDKAGKNCVSGGGGTLVLASHDYVYGPGGSGIFSDPKLGTILYYHYANTNIGLADADYQFGWNVLGWGGGWPAVT